MNGELLSPDQITARLHDLADRKFEFICKTWREIGRMEGVAMSWIKCSEQMPPAKGFYLVFIVGPFVSGIDCRYYHRDTIGWDVRHDSTVTHWQPLPEPPND